MNDAALGFAGALVVVAASQACSVDTGSSGATGDQSGGAGSGLSAAGGSGGGLNPTGAGGDESCAETEAEATEGVLPADIIIAVDTSGSMSLEAQWTQQNMNLLASTIVGSGIDAHVVMISNTDICVPAPLGSGSCPTDENLPSYRHVPQNVGSNDALVKIIDTYDQWKDSLRANATKTFVVVSDDDSDDMSASEFTNALLALSPTFQDFKFDAIVSSAEPFAFGHPCFALSAATGVVYHQLVAQTNGVLGDLCLQDFGPVFADMATAVIQGSQIPCVYDIPVPASGEEIDPAQVNVEYAPDANATAQDIFYVPGGAADCDAAGGWYYDDPVMPTQIFLCDATCDEVQISTDGKVTLKFGCATKVK